MPVSGWRFLFGDVQKTASASVTRFLVPSATAQ
jgi:hypothetical protein